MRPNCRQSLQARRPFLCHFHRQMTDERIARRGARAGAKPVQQPSAEHALPDGGKPHQRLGDRRQEIAANQHDRPEYAAKQEVPLRWTMNNRRDCHRQRTTARSICEAWTLMPSIALSTEMAGLWRRRRKARSPEQTDDDRIARRLLCLATWTDQGEQRQDAALAMIVGAHDQNCIFDGNDDDQRPEDQ